MKPVYSCEIVVDYGEFLYRKSSLAEPDVCSVSRGKMSSYVGCSKIMAGCSCSLRASLLSSSLDSCSDIGMRSGLTAL